MLVCEPKTLTRTNASPIQHLDASDTFGSIFKSRTIFNVPLTDCLINVFRPPLRTSFRPDLSTLLQALPGLQ